MRIVLQKFLVMIRLDHERVHFAQPLDRPAVSHSPRSVM